MGIINILTNLASFLFQNYGAICQGRTQKAGRFPDSVYVRNDKQNTNITLSFPFKGNGVHFRHLKQVESHRHRKPVMVNLNVLTQAYTDRVMVPNAFACEQ